ncbi:MAG: M23 family metallopeptidase [Acetobacteraceae bacterium]|jgi:murein DD-endopeptidase MepM/ murein hydrolase activator NlpD
MYRLAIAALAFWANSAIAQEYLLNPVDATCISSPFGPRSIRDHPEAGTFHFGIDFPAPEGSPVWAIQAGSVMKVQQNGPGGLEVLVQHKGFIGIYSHLGSVSARVLAGRTPIAAGEFLGVVGHSGLTFGAHLYFGMLHDGFPIDPSSLFNLPRCYRTELAGRH